MTERVEETLFEEILPSVPDSLIPYHTPEELKKHLDEVYEEMVNADPDSFISIAEGMAGLRRKYSLPTADPVTTH